MRINIFFLNFIDIKVRVDLNNFSVFIMVSKILLYWRYSIYSLYFYLVEEIIQPTVFVDVIDLVVVNGIVLDDDGGFDKFLALIVGIQFF